MAVYIVDKDNLIPGCYTDQGLATVAAVAAVDNAAEIRTVTAGVYGPLTINNSTISNTRYTNTVAGDYTIALSTATTAAWNNGPATVFEGGRITSGSRDAFRPPSGSSMELRDFAWAITDVGGYGYGARLAYPNSTLTLTRGVIGGAASIIAAIRVKAGGSSCALVVENVAVAAELDCSYAPIYAESGALDLQVRASCYLNDVISHRLIYIAAGFAFSNFVTQGCHGRAITGAGGAYTATAESHAHNVYRGNLAAASSATDVSGITDRRLGGIDGDTPLHDSPLRRVIPASVQYGGIRDRHGNPRFTDGQCVGPVQPQDVHRSTARKAA